MKEIIAALAALDIRHQMWNGDHVFTTNGSKFWALAHLALVCAHYKQSPLVFEAIKMDCVVIRCQFISEPAIDAEELMREIHGIRKDLTIYHRELDIEYAGFGNRIAMRASELELEYLGKHLDRIAHLEKDVRETKHYQALADVLREACLIVGDLRRKIVQSMSTQNKRSISYLEALAKMQKVEGAADESTTH